jgi:hypothetical protein
MGSTEWLRRSALVRRTEGNWSARIVGRNQGHRRLGDADDLARRVTLRLDANLNGDRGSAGATGAGEERDDIAHPDRLMELDRLHGDRDPAVDAVAASLDIARLIDE